MEKIKSIKRYPLIIMFIVIIFGFTAIDIITPDAEYSPLENKYLAQSPDFSVSAFIRNEFVPKYEKYIDEQFVLRDYWINLKSRSEYFLGKLENNGIVYGDDNFLFDKCLSIDEKKAARNLSMIENFIKTYSRENINIMLVPNSYEIMKEKVPYMLSLFNQKDYIEQVYNQLGKYDNVSTVDIYDVLREKNDEYIYYKTDHHWTTFGAYLAYCEFMNDVKMDAVSYDETKTVKIQNFLGTYFSKCKKYSVDADTINYLDYNDLNCTIGGDPVNSIYDYDKFSERDKYAAFLHGNNDITVIKNVNLKNIEKKRIMVIKDSFGNSFVPFLTNNYDEIYVVDLRANTEKVSSLIAKVKFDNILLLYSVENLVNDNNLIKINN